MPTRLPIFRYCVLVFLAAITLAYEVRYLHDIVRDEARNSPFFNIELATNRVDIVSKEAANTGIRKGDEVLSINGRPYQGLGDWARPFAETPAGGTVTVVVRSPDLPSQER